MRLANEKIFPFYLAFKIIWKLIIARGFELWMRCDDLSFPQKFLHLGPAAARTRNKLVNFCSKISTRTCPTGHSFIVKIYIFMLVFQSFAFCLLSRFCPILSQIKRDSGTISFIIELQLDCDINSLVKKLKTARGGRRKAGEIIF